MKDPDLSQVPIEELIRIAKLKVNPKDVELANANYKEILTNWYDFMGLDKGNEAIFATEFYGIFTSYCDILRVKDVPSVRIFGIFLKELVNKVRSNRGSIYRVNQTTAEMRKRNEKKIKEEERKAKKEYKQAQSQEA